MKTWSLRELYLYQLKQPHQEFLVTLSWGCKAYCWLLLLLSLTHCYSTGRSPFTIAYQILEKVRAAHIIFLDYLLHIENCLSYHLSHSSFTQLHQYFSTLDILLHRASLETCFEHKFQRIYSKPTSKFWRFYLFIGKNTIKPLFFFSPPKHN